MGELWDEILESTLSDVCRVPLMVLNQPLPSLIAHTYHPKWKVHHVKCYQQRTPNLCGYHAAFNTACFLNLVQGVPIQYDILSGACCWSFKRKIERFLLGVKRQHKLRDEWPWREHDILYGDFERTYNKLCLGHFPGFEIFRDHEHFEFLSYTWEFQYQNLLLSEEKKRELNKIIDYFRRYKEEKPLVGFMLAITNHWMLLIAVKFAGKTQFWFFDSSNRDFLELNHEEIDELVERLDQERKDLGKEPFSQFFKKNMSVCMRDTQISIKLIIDCLEGSTIEEYTYNQQFSLFASELEKHWEHDREMTIRDYRYNISAFFRAPVQHHLLTPQNHKRLAKLTQVSHELKNWS